MKRSPHAFAFGLSLEGLFLLSKAVLIPMLLSVEAIILFFTLYQIALSLLGLLKRRREETPTTHRMHRFALLVAAHNEEEVVGQIVDSLKRLEYPKDLYDIYVICDNCSDATAAVVRAHGGRAMERHDPDRRGKGYGLEWMFDQLRQLEQKGVSYDAVAMFDADNLVSPNFLRMVNKRLNQGHEVMQTYLDTKNPNDTWVTKSYAFAYWSTNRLFQLGREKLGLSAQLGGTGVVVTTSILQKIGWGATSLTEDLEFTARYILETGRRVAWVHEAKIYDEKPLGFKPTWKQRVRWMAGHVDVMFRYAWPLLRMAFRQRSMVAFDAAVYLTQPARTLLSLGTVGFFLLGLVTSLNGYDIPYVDHWFWLTLISLYFTLPIVALLLERRPRAIAWYAITYLFSLTWLPVILMGFIKRNNCEWNHTKHTRTMSAKELSDIWAEEEIDLELEPEPTSLVLLQEKAKRT